MSKYEGNTDCFSVSTFMKTAVMNPCQWRLCHGYVGYSPSSQWPKSQNSRLGFVVDRVVWERFSSKYSDVTCQYLSAGAAFSCCYLLQALYKLGNWQHHWLKHFGPCQWCIVFFLIPSMWMIQGNTLKHAFFWGICVLLWPVMKDILWL